MQTSVQLNKKPAQAVENNSTNSNYDKGSEETNEVLHSHNGYRRKAGNAFQNPIDGNEGTNNNVKSFLSYDLKKIPIHSAQRLLIQPKLSVNTPGDEYEQEADAIADKVMHTTGNGIVETQLPRTNIIRRTCEDCEKQEEDDPAEKMIFRKRIAFEEGQMLQRKESGNNIPSNSEAIKQTLQSQGHPMDKATRSFMEEKFGYDFSKVRIHSDSLANQSASDINALAYTNKHNIVFGAGKYQPQTQAGKKLLAHELTHTLQQSHFDIQKKEKNSLAETSPSKFIIEDDMSPVEGVMNKSEFLERLNNEVCATVNQELQGTSYSSDNCPYIRAIFARHANSSPAQIEQLAARYEPQTASAKNAMDLIRLILIRVRASVQQWKKGKELAEIPADISAMLAEMQNENSDAPSTSDSQNPSLQFKANPGGPQNVQSPNSVIQKLGKGNPLDSNTRAVMESAFETNFSNVEIHTDNEANSLSCNMNAKAFAVGNHIAFSQGEYSPGTLIGNALMAHELAHVMQQQGTSNHNNDNHSERLIEEDADHAAISVMTKIITGKDAQLKKQKGSIKGGLRLSRCEGCGDNHSTTAKEKTVEPPDAAKEKPAPPPKPEDLFKPTLESAIADNNISKTDWINLRSKAAETGIDDRDLSSLLSFDFDFGRDKDMMSKIILGKEDIYLKLINNYAPAITITSGTRLLNPNPVDALFKLAFEDNMLTQEEFMAVRGVSLMYDQGTIENAFKAVNIDASTAGQFISIFNSSQTDINELIKMPGFLPLKLNKDAKTGVLSPAIKLNTILFNMVLSDNEISSLEFEKIYSIIGSRTTRAEVQKFFIEFGVEQNSAGYLANEFNFLRYESLKKKTGFVFKFKPGERPFTLTQETIDNINLAFHPTPVNKFQPIEGRKSDSSKSSTEKIPSFTFSSGIAAPAEKMEYSFGGHKFTLIIDENVAINDIGIFDRVDHALSTIPAKYFILIKTLIVDPGNRDIALADANPDGKINLYLSGVGARVPQEDLDNTVIHEFGHLISFEESRKDPGFWTNWEKAIKDDGLGISRYGFTNEREDFAEAFVLYYSGGNNDKGIRTKYPNRFRLLDKAFSG